ncbi:hypothetical protein EWM64_g8413 [Hericium alpestre]|uniref:Uncharacterized protein n=1 Tax=Hericium alpestre TaxID=135208 RepID=A0A4Y9ZQ82_9AGAM|nr:hypothetical protein EWM64_g8413 [Hericium alpestre]
MMFGNRGDVSTVARKADHEERVYPKRKDLIGHTTGASASSAMLERLQFELASSDDNKFKLPAAVASLDLGNAEVGGNSVGSGTLALLDTGNDRILVPNPEAPAVPSVARSVLHV